VIILLAWLWAFPALCPYIAKGAAINQVFLCIFLGIILWRNTAIFTDIRIDNGYFVPAKG
jgi:sorbitol-specific phosphotransferase system component IIBC